MTIEERALVGMHTRVVEARELIQTNLRIHEFIQNKDKQVLQLLANADRFLDQLAYALAQKMSVDEGGEK